MLTIEKLNEWGADTQTGIQRCANKEDLYLKLVMMIPDNNAFKSLEEAVLEKDFEKGFQAAHGLKGILSNLELTPLLNPVKEITELFRNQVDGNYEELFEIIKEEREKLKKMCEE